MMRQVLSTIAASCLFLSILSVGNASKHATGQTASEKNQELVRSSRSAIIATGFSENYFDEHFKLVNAYNKPGDLRVVWRFALNGYETLVTDALGYYNGEHGKRIYVHSAANTLESTKDIDRTIPKARAEKLMLACIGKFSNESVIFMRPNAGEKLSLFLTAYARGKSDHRDRGTESRRDNSNPKNRSGLDEIPQEGGENERPVVIGYVNVETGKCSKGEATVSP